MKLSTKRHVDHYIGLPLALILNFAARMVGFLLRRDHSVEPVKRVLFMKFQGMGSLMLAKPAIAALRQQHPKAEFIFWGSPCTCQLAKLMPEFDTVYTLQDGTFRSAVLSVSVTLFRLWRQPMDWAFDLEVYSKISSILMLLTCARNRTSFATGSAAFRRNLHTHLVLFNRYQYLGIAYSRLLGVAGAPSSMPWLGTWTNQWPGQNILKLNIANLNQRPIKENYFVINPHAGPLALERRWPLTKYAKLMELLLRNLTDHKIVLIGHGSFEREQSQLFVHHERVVNLTDTLTLSETIQYLAHAKMVISGDTAPLHLALATQTRVLGLFGPTRAETYFPSFRPHSHAITLDLYCSPCVHHWPTPPCLGNNVCLKALSAEEVFEQLILLCEDQDEQPQPPLPSHQVEIKEYYPGLIYNRSQ